MTASSSRDDPARIPVLAIWHDDVGPLLSLGMLTAAVRTHRDGALLDRFEIGRPQRAEDAFEQLVEPRPAVLLLSNYVFTLAQNLATAAEAKRANPQLVVIHGGPSTPKYDADVERFLDDHDGIADILVHGEGEHALGEVLDLLRELPRLDHDGLAGIEGVSFRDPRTGRTVRTPPRDRIADLGTLASPYLTGEFDHIPPEQWIHAPYFETNRGCPYGCTFCDWGSATQSRIRKFPTDRVLAEFAWAADRAHAGLHICDANFGILPRDVDLAAGIAELRGRTGYPSFVIFTPAKNTVRNITKVIDHLTGAGVSVATSISLQTTDPGTLETVQRKNITTDGYLQLAADLRRRGHALHGDLILGLPGQTYTTYRDDLQFMLDHEIMPRTFPLRLLPNAPMNDPEYRERHEIVTDEHEVVISTALVSKADRALMLRLRRIEAITERYGVLRHLYRYLQWDHGVPAGHVMDALVRISSAGDGTYPAIEHLLATFHQQTMPATGWVDFYAEVRRFVLDLTGMTPTSGFDTVLALQAFLMPAPGRSFPASTELRHDYVAYYASATAELYRSGLAGRPAQPLEDYPPATFTVTGDPLDLCRAGLRFAPGSDDHGFEGDFDIGSLAANELLSPLVRILPALSRVPEAIRSRLHLAPHDAIDEVVLAPSWQRSEP